MAVTFWTDPHLGLNRTSHTTPQSRKALREALYKQALYVAKWGNNSNCLGDLFDSTDNEESVISQGADVARCCSLILSGNHDLPNRDGKLSSLQLIGELVEDSTIALDDSTDNFFEVDQKEALLVVVTHKRTQQLFEDAVMKAALHHSIVHKPTLLLLHCNYNSGFATDETSLNLSRTLAEEIIERFTYILIGHEHIPRSDFGGRLQILGNTHPTSFSDISDKYVWSLKEGKLENYIIWSDERHLVIRWEDLLSTGITRSATDIPLEFIEVTGVAPAAKLPEIAKAVQRLWAQIPTAYMIKNSVKAEAIVIDIPTHHKALDVPAQITAELENSKLLPLWLNYLEQV